MAKYSKAQKRASMKYNAKAYDDIKVRVPKGKREEYQSYAEAQGKSLNQLIIELLENNIKDGQ